MCFLGSLFWIVARAISNDGREESLGTADEL